MSATLLEYISNIDKTKISSSTVLSKYMKHQNSVSSLKAQRPSRNLHLTEMYSDMSLPKPRADPQKRGKSFILRKSKPSSPQRRAQPLQNIKLEFEDTDRSSEPSVTHGKIRFKNLRPKDSNLVDIVES